MINFLNSNHTKQQEKDQKVTKEMKQHFITKIFISRKKITTLLKGFLI